MEANWILKEKLQAAKTTERKGEKKKQKRKRTWPRGSWTWTINGGGGGSLGWTSRGRQPDRSGPAPTGWLLEELR